MSASVRYLVSKSASQREWLKLREGSSRCPLEQTNEQFNELHSRQAQQSAVSTDYTEICTVTVSSMSTRLAQWMKTS